MTKQVEVVTSVQRRTYGDSAFNYPWRDSAQECLSGVDGVGPRLSGLGSPGPSLDVAEKAIVAKRPSNALCGAQAGEQIGLGLAGKQPVRIGRHEDEVYMVRHQTPGPHIDLGGAAIFGAQDYHTGEAGHAP